MKRGLSISFFLVLFSIFFTPPTYAAATTMDFSPANGKFDKAFKVNLIIDGHGDKFNAAEATVKLSPNLKVKDVIMGDCHFSSLRTPSTQNPSFAGIIIKTYSKKCTAYTLTLLPIQKGKATITVADASVKRYGDAAEVLKKASNASYELTGVVKDVLGEQMKNTSKDGLYTVYLSVYSEEDTPVKNATVVLNGVDAKDRQEAKTDDKGVAHFSNVKQGVYDAAVTQWWTKVGETIVNVQGTNHVLSLGISLNTQSSNPLLQIGNFMTGVMQNPFLLGGILLLGVIAGVLITLGILKVLQKKRKKKHEESKQ